jgi:general L-amino acid transport system permease protein
MVDDAFGGLPKTGRASRGGDTSGVVAQAILALCLIAAGWYVVSSTQSNLAARGIASGFGFLARPAGFDLAFSAVPFTAASPLWMALVAGIANTLFLAVTGAVVGTVLGLIVVAVRLSPSPAAEKLAAGYIGLFRNTPVLLHLSFWYFAVFAQMPPVHRSLTFGDIGFLNNRGLYIPSPTLGVGVLLLVAFCLAAPSLGAAVIRRQSPTSFFAHMETGIVIGVALAALVAVFGASSWSVPARAGLGIRGGTVIIPELMAAIVAISVYSSAYIAELLRGGISNVERGQTEAGQSLGLPKRVIMRRIILPQAIRLVIPPLTNQYVNIVKITAIVASIGFPDLMLIFGKTVLTLTGQAIEALTIVSCVYLIISLLASGLIHVYSRRLGWQGARR